MNISSYPDFRPLEIGDLNTFESAFKNSPPVISEFTFTNLYSWREAYNFKIAELNGLIILRTDSSQGTNFFTPIGKGDIKAAMGQILKDTKGSFIRVPEAIQQLFAAASGIKIEFDRDNSDYLYRVADLVSLKGSKYDGKRNLIKKFKSGHQYEYGRLSAANVPECLEFEQTWCTIKNCDSVQGLSNERKALKEMAYNFSAFGLIGGAIRIAGKICAVAIAQRLNSDTLVMHILKADPNLAGLYQLINNEFLAREAGDFRFVNLEEDLGLEGLRKSKLSYHPLEMVKKYIIKKE